MAALWRFWQMDGHLDAGTEHTAAALALDGGTPEARAHALGAAGGLAYWRGDFAAQLDHYRAALRIWRDLDDNEQIADTCYNLAYATQVVDGFAAANRLLVEAEERFRHAGDGVGLGRVYWAWGNLYQVTGDFGRAVEYCERSIDHFDTTRHVFDLGWAEFVMAECLLELGQIDAARTHLRSGMNRFRDAGDLSAMVLFLAAFSELCWAMGDRDTGARLIGAMRSLRDETGAGLIDADPAHQRFVRISGNIDPQDQQAFREGSALSIEDAVALAMERTE